MESGIESEESYQASLNASLFVIDCSKVEEIDEDGTTRLRSNPFRGCNVPCEKDPFTGTAIDPAYLIRVCMLRESCAIGESIVCYDIRNLYKFMLKKNREPTSNTAFPPEEVAKITQLYRTMTNQPNAEARHPRRFSFLDVNKLLRPRISPYMQAPRLLSKKDVEIARAFANGNWELGFRMTNFLGVIRSSPHDSFFYENIKALEESCRERLSTVNPDNPGNPFEQEVVNNPFRLEEIPRIVTENPEDSRVLLDLFKYLVEDVKPEHISLSRWLWSFSGFRVPYWFERFVASTNINPSPSIGWPDVKAVMKRIINRYETETEQLSHQATNIASKENPDIASLIQTFYDPKAAQQDISERAKYKAYLVPTRSKCPCPYGDGDRSERRWT